MVSRVSSGFGGSGAQGSRRGTDLLEQELKLPVLGDSGSKAFSPMKGGHVGQEPETSCR